MEKIQSISDAVRNYFEANKWEFDFVKDGNIFQTAVHVDSEIEVVLLNIVIQGDAFFLVAVPGIQIPKTVMKLTEHYVVAVNAQLGLGGFFLRKDEDTLFFRQGMICADAIPTYQQLDAMIGYGVSISELAAEAVKKVTAGILTPEQAAEQTMSS